MKEMMQQSVAGIELWRVFVFVFALLMASLLAPVVRYVLERIATRPAVGRHASLPVVLRTLARSTWLLFFAAGFWFGLPFLSLSPAFQPTADVILRVLMTTAVGLLVYRMVDVVDFYMQRVANRTESRMDDALVPLVGRSVRVIILLLIVVQVLQSLSDKPVASILAGLGVGGLAAALAAQESIKNFFGSIVILADKPFEIGDRVIIDTFDGEVESVGFRSTRLRTLDGELVTVPNADVAAKAVRNVGKRIFIRYTGQVGLTYDTSPADVERATGIIKALIEGHEGQMERFPPRVYFKRFDDSSLTVEFVFWFPPDYWNMIAFAEHVNLEILRKFNEAGLKFAFPTRTVHVAGAGVPAKS